MICYIPTKRSFVPLGVSTQRNEKCIAPLVGAAIIAGGASLLGSLFGHSSNSSNVRAQRDMNRENNETAKLINQQNIDFQRETNSENFANQWQMFNAANKEYDRRQSDLVNSSLVKRQALSKAGMNLNSEFGGFSPIASSSSAPLAAAVSPHADFYPGQPALGSSDWFDASGLASIAGMLQQKPVLDANTRKINADAERQEIENDRLNHEDSQYNLGVHNLTSSSLSDEVSTMFATSTADIDSLLPSVEINGKDKRFNKGDFDAIKDIREYRSTVARLEADDVENILRKAVANSRNKNAAVIKALANLPAAEYRKLSEEILNIIEDRKLIQANATNANKQGDKLDLDIDFEKWWNEHQKNSSLTSLAQRYLDGDIGLGKAIIFGLFSIAESLNTSFRVR